MEVLAAGSFTACLDRISLPTRLVSAQPLRVDRRAVVRFSPNNIQFFAPISFVYFLGILGRQPSGFNLLPKNDVFLMN